MKKFLLLAVIATLVFGVYAIDYTVSVRTNDIPQVFMVYRNGNPMGMTNGITPVVFTNTDVTMLTGLWTIDPAPPGNFWAPPVQFQVQSNWFTENNNHSIVLNWNLFDEVVPVELSSFTATLTALNDVQINWVTQTETNMLGYRVYRNDGASQNNAVLITPTLILAHNTSQLQSYNVVDNEVEIGSTYFYWLESVEANSSDFFGPVSITVQGEVPPVYPEVTTLKKAYPNPFRANTSTNIEVELKDGETGTVTIYNLQGKVVKVYDVTPGSHTITWNGTDSKGAACSSGIYLYKLSTPSANATEKMVIIK